MTCPASRAGDGASPSGSEGGACAADARSDPEDASQWQAEDPISRGYKHDPDFMNLVQNTKTVDEISLDAGATEGTLAHTDLAGEADRVRTWRLAGELARS